MTDSSTSPDVTTEVREAAEEVEENLSDDLDTTTEEIINRLSMLKEQYMVPLDEAKRSVVRTLHDEADVDGSDDNPEDSQNETRVVNDIDEEELWLDLKGVKVVELWDPNSDSVAQVGLIGDESGKIKFTKWAKSDLPELTEGQVYDLRNIVSDEYQGRYSVKLNKTTKIEAVDTDVEVGTGGEEVSGALVSVQSGEGLIKRCTATDDCTRVLDQGRCKEHGEVEGEFDLRIKAVLDDGQEAHEVIFGREKTAEVTGIDMEQAQEIAKAELDTSKVLDRMEPELLGYYFTVKGPKRGRYRMVNEVSKRTEPADAEETLIRGRSI